MTCPLALAARPRQERQQHPDAEVEPLEQEVAAPENGDQAEPDGLERHLTALSSPRQPPAVLSPSARSGRLWRIDAGVAAHEDEVDDAEA